MAKKIQSNKKESSVLEKETGDEFSVIAKTAKNKTKTETEYSKPQQNARIKKLLIQWKISEHGLASSDLTVTQSVVISFYLALELLLYYTIY